MTDTNEQAAKVLDADVDVMRDVYMTHAQRLSYARILAAALREPTPAPDGAEAVAWVRFCSDKTIEGPVLHAAMCDVRIKSGKWTPLYTHPPQPASATADVEARAWLDKLHDLLLPKHEGRWVNFAARMRATAAGVEMDGCRVVATPQPASGEVRGLVDVVGYWKMEAATLLAQEQEKDPHGGFRWASWMRDQMRDRAGTLNRCAREITAALACDTGERGVVDALRNIAEGNLGDGPGQANYARIRETVAAALRAQPAGGGESLSVAQGQGWLPIESAPRDGTPILLGYINSHAEEGFWMGDASRNHWNETGWYATGEDVLCEHPSHPDVWQPLPAAPAQPDGVRK